MDQQLTPEEEFHKAREKFVEALLEQVMKRPDSQLFVIFDDPMNGPAYMSSNPTFVWQLGVLRGTSLVIEEMFQIKIRQGVKSGALTSVPIGDTTITETKVH